MNNYKNTSRKLISIILTIALVVGLMPGLSLPIWAASQQGKCGPTGAEESLLWELEDGKLTIAINSEYEAEGHTTARMADYSSGSAAPWYGKSFSSVQINSNVENVGAHAFDGFTGVKSITIYSGLTSIGAYAFNGCTGITSVNIPSTVTTIGEKSFGGCTAIRDVTLNGDTTETSIATDTFSGVTQAKLHTHNDWYLNIVNTLDSNGYYSLGGGTFVLPQGYCGAVGNESGVTWILSDDSKTLTISGTGNMMDFSEDKRPGWYKYRSTIESIKIGNEVTSIGSSAFEGCSKIKSIEVSSAVTTIGEKAFSGCTSLKNVTLYGGTTETTSVASDSFSGVAQALLTVQPDRLQSFIDSSDENGFFTWCGGSFKMAQGYCGATGDGTNITWKLSSDGKTLTVGGSGAMKDFSSSKRPGWYTAKDTIETIQIGSNVTNIGNYAFADLTKVTSVNIPLKATSIGEYAFSGSGLTAVNIPNFVTLIGNYAFKDCPLDLTISGTGNINISDTAFSGIGSSSSPKTLTQPDARTDKPANSNTAWHGGYFSLTTSPWTALNNALTNGQSYTLSQDITYQDGNTIPIKISNGNATLNLNNYTLSSNGTGRVIEVSNGATLNLNLGTGKLDGSIDVKGGATLNITGSTGYILGSVSVSGSTSKVNFTGGQIEASSPVSGSIGGISIATPTAITVYGGTVTINGGKAVASEAVVEVYGGSLIVQGDSFLYSDTGKTPVDYFGGSVGLKGGYYNGSMDGLEDVVGGGRYSVVEESHSFTRTRTGETVSCGLKVEDRLKPFTVTLYPNYYNNGSGNPIGPTDYSAGEMIVLSSGTFLSQGYSISSWNTKQDGTGTSYGKNDNITGVSSDIVLYAQWEPSTYSVQFDTKGGKINSGGFTSYIYGQAKTLPTDVTRDNYEFEGWYTGENGTGRKVTEISATDFGYKTYYANWIGEKYTIELDYQGGSGNTTFTYRYGETTTLPTSISNGSKAFSGWFTQANGQGTKVTALGPNKSTYTKLYAYWVDGVIKYNGTVYSNLDKINSSDGWAWNGGTLVLLKDIKWTGSRIDVSTYKERTLDLNGHGILVTDYLEGFFLLKNGNNTNFIIKDSSPDVVNYIRLNDSDYPTSVTQVEPSSGKYIRVNGGYITGAFCQIGNLYSEATITIQGGSFVGNVVSRGYSLYDKNPSYSQKVKIAISGNPVISSARLSAGSTISLSGALTEGASIGVRMDSPGVFTSGWSTYMSGKDPTQYFYSVDPAYSVVKDGDELKLDNSKKTIIFDSQGGSEVSSQVITSGGKVNKPTDPTRSGHIFGGWYTEAACTNEYDFSTAVTNGFTLYAKWVNISECTASLTSGTQVSYYASIVDAIAAWSSASEGAILTLINDTSTDSVINVSGNKVLDLNGNKLTYTGTVSAINVASSANLTLKDSASGGTIVSNNGNGINLATGKVINLDPAGPLSPPSDSKIKVTMEKPGVFTSGWLNTMGATDPSSVFSGEPKVGQNGTTMEAEIIAVKPAAPTAPAATSISALDTSITINSPTVGYQYLVVKVTNPETMPTEAAWSSNGKVAQTGDTSITFDTDSNGDPIKDSTAYKVYVRVPVNNTTSPVTPASDFAKSSAVTTKPAAPAAVSGSKIGKTGNSISIADTLTTQEYIVVPKGTVPAENASGWKTGVGSDETLTFDGLDPGTEYEIYTRIGGTNKSALSSPRSVTTMTVAPDPINRDNIGIETDKITINPSASGQQYVIVPKGQTPTESDWGGGKYGNGGELLLEGLTPGEEYDIYTRTKQPGTEASENSTPISIRTLQTQDTPDTPVVDSKGVTSSSISITTLDGQEYVVTTSPTPPEGDWSTLDNYYNCEEMQEHTFDGLSDSTKYYIHSRRPAYTDDTTTPPTVYMASNAVTSSGITTLQPKPESTDGYTINYSNEQITIDTGYEISVDDDFSTTLSNPATIDPGKTYYVRKAATDSLPASDPATFTAPARPAAPAEAPTLSEGNDVRGDKFVKIASEASYEYIVVPKADYQDDNEETLWANAVAAGIITGTGENLTLNKIYTNSDLIPGNDYVILSRVKATNEAFHSLSSRATEVTTKDSNVITQLTIAGWTYGKYSAETNAPSVTSTHGAETATFEYYLDSSCETKTTAENSGAVSEGGLPVNAGTYYVKAYIAETADYISASKVTSFVIAPAPITLKANSAEKTYNGSEQTLTGFTCYEGENLLEGLTFTGVTASGSGTTVGNYDVTFSGVTFNNTKDDSGNYIVTATTKGVLSILVKSADSEDISAVAVNGTDALTFNGKPQSPTIEVKDGDRVLTVVTDYTINYTGTDVFNNAYDNAVAPTNSGSYKATITFCNNYSGSKEVDFEIAKYKITTADITYGSDDGLEAGHYTYTGEIINPAITVSTVLTGDTDATSLIKGTDYESYQNLSGTDIGTYFIKYEGRGNYTGSVYKAWYIDAKTITITADDLSKIYGDKDPKLTATVSSAYTDDLPNIDYTVTREEGENAGEYTINVTGNETQGNYKIVYKPGTFTINKATATVTADDLSKTYGDKNPELTAKVTGLKNGDEESVITYTLSRAEGEDVNTYDITPAGDAEQGNYNVVFTKGTFTINKRSLSTTFVKLKQTSFQHDGNVKTPEVVFEGYNAVKDTDFTVSGDTSAKDSGAHTITVSGLAPNFTGRIKLTWYITGVADDEFTYDGQPHSISVTEGTEITYKQTDGTYGSQKPEYTNAGKYTIDYKTVVDNPMYGLVDGEQETIEVEGSAVLVINPAPLTVKADNKNKVYGTADPEFTFTVTGLVGEEKIDDVFTNKKLTRDAGEDVGDYDILQGDELAVNDNYEIVGFEKGIFSITKKPLVVSTFDIKLKPSSSTSTEDEVALNGNKVPYGSDGFDVVVVPGKDEEGNPYTGVGDVTVKYYSVTVDDQGTEIETELPAGTKPTEAGQYRIKLQVAEGANYAGTGDTLISDPSWSFEITKSDFPSDVMNNDDYWPTEIDDISYTGQKKALLTGAKNQAPEGYTLQYSTDGENWSNSIPEGTDAGDYKLYVKYTSNDGNHSDSEPKEYSFTVAKKAASVTFDANQGKTYGESDPELTATTDGTIGSDKLNYTLSRAEGEDVGEYAVTVTPGTNKNYNVTVTGGTFAIAKKEVTLTADDKSKTYGESDPEFTATAGENDIVGTDTLNYTVSRAEGENAGEYDITVAVGENKNYEVKTIGGKLTIQKKSITIQADSISKPYGDPDPELTATVNGLVGDDTLNYELGRSEGDAIQDYDINITLGENPNYDVIITPVEKPFSITKRSIILTSATETKTYDGSVLTNDQITVSGDGWLDGDGATYDVTGSQKLIGKSENTFTYKLNEGTNPDFYDISTVVGTLTVTDRDDASKYEITVKSKGGEYTYDSKEHSAEGFETLEFTINGEKYTVSGLSASAKGTNAGTYSSVISGNAIITDSTGNDVTSQFKVTKSNGELIINKAEPKVNKPEGIELTSGDKLSDVKLPEGWSWENPDAVVDGSGTATYKLVYTPKDSTNYKSVVVEITVTVNGDGEVPTSVDEPEDQTTPDRDEATKYEITVKSKGGEYTYDGKEHSAEGFETLEFTINGEKYTVSGLSASIKGTNAGTYSSVISGNAIITDSTGNDVTSQFKVTKSNGELIINKAEPKVNKPEGIELTSGDKLSDVKLPEGWSWENPDAVVDGSGTATYKLVYTPKDSTNYKSVVVEITVTVNGDGEVPTSFDKPEEPDESEDQTTPEKYDREWVDGQWYDADGNADYAPKGSWKHSDKGWWYEDETGWYPTDSWMKVDGKWYFFDEYGFMISNQYCGKWSAGNEGLFWVGVDGAWDEGKPAYWHMSGNKRWLGDETGWYAHDCVLLVNGTYLEFDSDGFLK